MAEHHETQCDGRESARRFHVSEFLPDQRAAPRGREWSGSLSTGRRRMDGAAAASVLERSREVRDPPRCVQDARFDVATPADDAEIRRVLRENPMPGAIRLSLEREPDAQLA